MDAGLRLPRASGAVRAVFHGRGPRGARVAAVVRGAAPYTSISQTLNPQTSTLNPQPSTLNPQPSTLNPQPSTLAPRPSILNVIVYTGQ